VIRIQKTQKFKFIYTKKQSARKIIHIEKERREVEFGVVVVNMLIIVEVALIP